MCFVMRDVLGLIEWIDVQFGKFSKSKSPAGYTCDHTAARDISKLSCMLCSALRELTKSPGGEVLCRPHKER